jgi:hypothetical protein
MRRFIAVLITSLGLALACAVLPGPVALADPACDAGSFAPLRVEQNDCVQAYMPVLEIIDPDGGVHEALTVTRDGVNDLSSVEVGGPKIRTLSLTGGAIKAYVGDDSAFYITRPGGQSLFRLFRNGTGARLQCDYEATDCHLGVNDSSNESARTPLRLVGQGGNGGEVLVSSGEPSSSSAAVKGAVRLGLNGYASGEVIAEGRDLALGASRSRVWAVAWNAPYDAAHAGAAPGDGVVHLGVVTRAPGEAPTRGCVEYVLQPSTVATRWQWCAGVTAAVQIGGT